MSMRMADGGAQKQADVIGFLSARADKRIETHGALVFLVGGEAFKIKRAVRLPYMDFSTLALRRQACERELAINRTDAPGLYLGVVPITRENDGLLALGGRGEPVEWAVHMRRFGADDLLATIAGQRGVDTGLAREIADKVAASHARAPGLADADGPARVLAVIEEIAAGIGRHATALGADDCTRLGGGLRAHHARAAPLLAARAAAGLVRRCHGDLHLGNLVLWQGRPTLFDALEFDETLATIDTLYDLAYLLMDLDQRGCRPAAGVVLDRYLWRNDRTSDIDGLAALPLFLSMRAAIRAMVLCDRAAQHGGPNDGDSATEPRRYLAAALAYLAPPPPRLVAVGGLSGTGKSTLAAALAPLIGAAPGALHLRSDLERKAMHGVAETGRLPPSIYTREESARVYARLRGKARRALRAGQAVLVDAAFLQQSEHIEIEAEARALGVPFHGLWLTAPAETLLARVAARHGDASDATPDVVRRQIERGAGGGSWSRIDASGNGEATLAAALAVLAGAGAVDYQREKGSLARSAL